MGGVAHVWPEATRTAAEGTEASAVVEWPIRLTLRRWPRRQRVWIRVPPGIPVPERASGDAFLLATTFGALRRARVLHVHAGVTDDLLEGARRLAALWVGRDPGAYRSLEIRADATSAGVPPEGPALLAFSGGLDSTYSLARHAAEGGAGGGRRLGAAVMVRGADIPVEEEAAFAAAFARARRIAQSRGVALLEAATNLRAVKQKWTHSYTAGLAAVLTLFRGGFGGGLVASGVTLEEARAWWPQDETDPRAVSCSAFPIAGDGYEADRLTKLESLRAWPEALANLRVCFRAGSWTGNCGTCFKCRVARLMARVAFGEVPPCLPDGPAREDVRAAAACRDPMILLRFAQIRRGARAKGLEAPWLDDVDRVLAAAGTRSAP